MGVPGRVDRHRMQLATRDGAGTPAVHAALREYMHRPRCRRPGILVHHKGRGWCGGMGVSVWLARYRVRVEGREQGAAPMQKTEVIMRRTPAGPNPVPHLFLTFPSPLVYVAHPACRDTRPRRYLSVDDSHVTKSPSAQHVSAWFSWYRSEERRVGKECRIGCR